MKKTIYIAGPMSGIPYFNFPAFDTAKAFLILQGWDVVSPADHLGSLTTRDKN